MKSFKLTPKTSSCERGWWKYSYDFRINLPSCTECHLYIDENRANVWGLRCERVAQQTHTLKMQWQSNAMAKFGATWINFPNKFMITFNSTLPLLFLLNGARRTKIKFACTMTLLRSCRFRALTQQQRQTALTQTYVIRIPIRSIHLSTCRAARHFLSSLVFYPIQAAIVFFLSLR